jgi:hypothetical protein
VRKWKGRKGIGQKNFSQTANPIRETTPNTIMQIILALAQPSGWEDARLKGRRIKEKPPEQRSKPRTKNLYDSLVYVTRSILIQEVRGPGRYIPSNCSL